MSKNDLNNANNNANNNAMIPVHYAGFDNPPKKWWEGGNRHHDNGPALAYEYVPYVPYQAPRWPFPVNNGNNDNANRR